MKKCTEKLLTVAAICCLSAIFAGKARAQHVIFLFGHVLYAAPVESNFKNNYNFGAGVEGGVGLSLLSKTFLTGTVGYSKFQHSDANAAGGISYVPVKIGLRHYLFARILYVHADAGLGLVSSTGSSGNSATKFSGDFGAGVKLGFFELQADYDGFTASNPTSYASWIGIKAGFNLGL